MAASAKDMVSNAPSALKTAIARARSKAYKHNKNNDTHSRMSMAEILEDAGMEPGDFFEIPSMEGRLSGELLRQYNEAVDSLMRASYLDDRTDEVTIAGNLGHLIEYQQDALQELQRNFETLNDPNASQMDKAKARMSAQQLSTREMGNYREPDSPLKGHREGGASYFDQDVRFENLSPEELAQYLDDPEQLNADDYMVSDQLDQRGQAYREAREGIDYEDVPTRETASVADIDERTVGDEELIDPAIADELLSKWDDPDFAAGIDRKGQDAVGSSLDYFDELIANDGRDAVSEAFLNRATGESEMRRRANVEAGLASLDARGMGGSGMELQTYLQGAGQSQQAQFDAAMEAASMAQQRKDGAAEQRAIQGMALQMMVNGEAVDMATAIDKATAARTQMRYDTAAENADTHTSAADQNFAWSGQQSMANADLSDRAMRDQFEGDRQEGFARNRDTEAAERQIYATGVGGAIQDAGTRRSTDEGNRAYAEAGKNRAVGQVNIADDRALEAERLQHEMTASQPNGWDYAAALAGFVPGGAQVLTALDGLGGDD